MPTRLAGFDQQGPGRSRDFLAIHRDVYVPQLVCHKFLLARSALNLPLADRPSLRQHRTAASCASNGQGLPSK